MYLYIYIYYIISYTYMYNIYVYICMYIYIFFEKSMRGGVTCISKRYSKANSNYLKSYDPKQESKHIIYLEVINLYRYAVSKCLSFF